MLETVRAEMPQLPAIGYGTWRLPAGRACVEAVTAAIDAGYRLIDTAYSYGNDFSVGKAIKGCAVPRDELAITNKAWNSFAGAEVGECCRKSLKLMKLDYFDLYLLHWPVSIHTPDWKQQNYERWRAMEQLYREGFVRAIGVSNFLPHHLAALEECGAEITPMVNQVEFHPGCYQKEVLEVCHSRGISMQGWSPLGSAALLQHPLIAALAERYGKTPAQICLHWAVQHGVTPVPRSSSAERMAENLRIFDFELRDEDMQQLNDLAGVGCSEYSPDINHPATE